MIKRYFVCVLAVFLLTACADPAPAMPDTWDLVFMSASNGWLVPDQYARLIEESQGVTVNVYDLTIGSLSAGEVLDGFDDKGRVAQRIRQEAPDLDDPLDIFRNAEVIVISVFDPYGSLPHEINNNWNCLAERSYVDSCDMEAMTPYFDNIRAILDHLFELRAGQPTIIRAFELYARPAWWLDDPVEYEACSTCWRLFLDTYADVLAEYNIPIAPVYQVWSEPDYRGDPQDKGFISFDNIHPSGEGAQSMAQLLHDLGYAVTEPPTP